MFKLFSQGLWNAVDNGDTAFSRRMNQWMLANPEGGFKAFWDECGNGDAHHFDLAKKAFVGMKNPDGKPRTLEQLDDRNHKNKFPIGGLKARR